MKKGKGFFNRLFTGGMLGAISAWLFKSNKKPIMSNKTEQKVKKQAKKVADEVSEGVKELKDYMKK
ncbi:gas vesicle protein [Desulfitispora alkaliphila]|uniref:hypothetical protein n=1 Tax=Desulfitispora alkaliphila TaxID=622674 RepID=UPI003D261CBB